MSEPMFGTLPNEKSLSIQSLTPGTTVEKALWNNLSLIRPKKNKGWTVLEVEAALTPILLKLQRLHDKAAETIIYIVAGDKPILERRILQEVCRFIS